MAEGTEGTTDVAASLYDNKELLTGSKLTKHSKQTSNDMKQKGTTQKPRPRRRHSNCSSKAATEFNEDIMPSTLDSTPTTLRVNAIQSKFPDHISDEHLRQHFLKYEKYIIHAVVFRNKGGWYGLVTFSSYDVAETARKLFRNQRLLGCLTNLSLYKYPASPKNQMHSKGTSFEPSMANTYATGSLCIGEPSSTKILHQAAEFEHAGDLPTDCNTIYVEGMHSKLPDIVCDEDLMKHFSTFGNDITSASIVRDPQTKLSAGYGIIVFKSPVVAKKAQRKYNGTHLCRKYQLRVTPKNLASDEGIVVLSSSNNRKLLESNIAAPTKKLECQNTDDCSATSTSVALEADVSALKSLNDKETHDFFTEGLVVENLSSIAEESELKALVNSCGASVSSFRIQQNPAAIDTCVANIALVDSSQLGSVIKQLNDKVVYKRKLRVYAAREKPLLHVEERTISSTLFEFITKNSHSQIKKFEEKGGVFKYQEPKGCALISASAENVTTEFLLEVFSRYTEKTLIFKPSQWNQLTQCHIRDKYTPSLLNRAGSKFRGDTDVHIIPQIDKHEILFVGTFEGVARTSSWLLDQLPHEVEIESDKMEALIVIYPTLDSELSEKFHIKVLNYSKDSTTIVLDGDIEGMQKAQQEIEMMISKFCVAEVSFEHPTLLLDSAQKRIKEDEVKVSIKTPAVASKNNPVSLTVTSFCPKQLDKATAILKGRPTYKSLRFPSNFNIDKAKLKTIQADIRKQCHVSVRPIYKQKTCTSLLICSFVKNDVSDAHGKLQDQLFSDSAAKVSVSDSAAEVSVKHKPAPKDEKKHDVSSSARLHASPMVPKPITIKTSSKHCISIKKSFFQESHCRASVTLSTEMTYYVQNKADWLKEITKGCMPVKVPKKVNLASTYNPSSVHMYIFEGKTVIIDKMIDEMLRLAQVFCVKLVNLHLPTENVRLMQSRWTEFKERSEAVHSVYIDFTLVSPKQLHLTSKGESFVTFTLCANNSEQLKNVVQHLQTNENGLNLPVQEAELSEDQLMLLNSMIANEQLNLDKNAVIIKVFTETRCLMLKAASKRNLDIAYRDILTLLESSVPSHSKEDVSHEYERNEHLQPLHSSQPKGIKCCSLYFEPHYIPLFLSQAFLEIAYQFEKAHSVCVVSISEGLINSTVKQVIYKTSSGHLITVQVCYSNLHYERVDAIVNCSRKLSHSMKAIGGEALQHELDNHVALETDSFCACLESGSLPCSKIVHVISSLQDETGPSNFSFIERALECAQTHTLKVTSFPFASEDVIAAENFAYNLKKFFIKNPDSCVHLVRIVCGSEKVINVCSSIKEFNSKAAIVDLPKSLPEIKPPLKSTEHMEYQWYWQADNGSFVPYSKEINDSLVIDYKRCATGRCYFRVGSSSYIANFERMEQSNMATRFIRKMKVEHINQKKKIPDASHGNPDLRVSVKWYHLAQGKECSPYSAHYSASIEKLYLHSSGSHTLQINSGKFLYDFKTMQKLAIQQPEALPYDEICIQRKVVVHQSTKSPTLSSPQWYYWDDTKKFSPYSKHDSADIEVMYQNGTPHPLPIQSKVYTFDFNDMNQINVSTGYKRSIKRVMKSSVDPHSQSQLVPLHHICKGIVISVEGSFAGLQEISDKLKVKVDSMVFTNELPLPDFITSSVDSKTRIMKVAKKYNVLCEITSKAMDVDLKVLKISGAESIVGKAIKEVMEEIVTCNPGNRAIAIQMPPEWQPQKKNTQLFELSKSSSEYVHVESMFHSTMSKTSTVILSISRIQNNWLWEKYVMTRNRMSRKNNGRINERELFHGSRNCRAHNIYDSEEGFDMRYSSEGMWGQANYFAEKASYSNSYAYELTDGSREMLLAKVLTGDSCKCESDRKLRKPPLKVSQTHFQQETYDTVEGETGGSKVFMTYNNDKAYPAYLIVYNPQCHSESVWRSSSRQTTAAQTSAPAASWTYNLNPASSTQSSSASVNAAAPPTVNPSSSYQGRSNHPHNIPPQPIPRITHPPPKATQSQSDQKGCILQ